MPPRLVSHRLAAAACSCSCRRSPSSAASSVQLASQTFSSTSTHTPLPLPAQSDSLPDFLCPSFGFFSRSLPTPRTAVAPTHWPILHRHERDKPPPERASAGTRRRGWIDSRRCICGRDSASCLRCRGVATSARAHDAEDGSPTPSDHTNESPELEDKVEPPIPPASGRRGHRKKSGNPPPSHLQTELDAMVEKLPADYRSLDEAWRENRWEPKDAVTAIRRLSTAQTRTSVAGLNELQQLDLVRAYGRIARAPKSEPAHAPAPLMSLLELEDASGRAVVRPSLRERAGTAMLELAEQLHFHDPIKSPGHRRSKASVCIDALGLAGRLPPIPLSPSNASTRPFDAFATDLLTIFGPPPDILSDEHMEKATRSKLQTLANLVDAWQRTPDGPQQAVTFLAGWDVLELINVSQEERGRRDTIPKGLRKALTRLVGRLAPSPSEWLSASAPADLDPGLLRRALVWSLALGEQPLEALKVFNHSAFAAAVSDDLEVLALTDLVVGLTRARLFADAEALSSRLEHLVDKLNMSDPRSGQIALSAWRALARLSAEQGRTDQTYAFIERLQRLGWDGGLEPAAIMMRSRSQKNELGAVAQIFRESMATVAATDRDRVRLWSELIWAHVRLNDVEGGLRALDNLVKAGLRPNLAILNTLLSGFSMRTDIDGAYALFNRFSTFDLTPDVVSYTSLVALHSRLRDPEAAMAVFRQSLSNDIAPDRTAWTAMMDLFVEAGYFALAAEIYAYILAQPNRAVRPDTACTNVVLKAIVASGASYETMFGFFRGAIASGFRPDLKSYTLALQSLCASGQMETAEELVREMQLQPGSSLLPRHRGVLSIDVYIIGILLHGYLTAGETAKGRACLLDMRARGIGESSVIYGLVVGSYLRANPVDGIAAASKLAQEFLDTSPLEPQRRTLPVRHDLPLARGTAPISVAFPLIQELGRNMKAVHALQFFRRVLDESVHPPIKLYTTLMDGYRRVADDESVSRIWKHIHEAILEAYPSKDSTTHAMIDTYHREALCVPFTIFIDSFSDRGAYQPIVRMWRTLAAEGFVFDASNWNRFGIVSCRWNQVEQAFWIAEHVLLRADDVNAHPDPSAFARELGPLGKVGHSLTLRPRTPIHIILKRERKQGQTPFQYRRPTLASLLDPTPDEPLAGPAEMLTNTHNMRASLYWRPHSAFLEALDKALRSGAGADSKLRGTLIKDHPRTMEAIHRWRQVKWRDIRSAPAQRKS